MLSLLAKLTPRSGGGSTPSRMLMIKRRKKRTSAVAPRHRLTPSRRTRDSESDNKAASPVGSPSVVVVMGVSGCGKSTIASLLGHRLSWIFGGGDWFHPPWHLGKMPGGETLDEGVRVPVR